MISVSFGLKQQPSSVQTLHEAKVDPFSVFYNRCEKVKFYP